MNPGNRNFAMPKDSLDDNLEVIGKNVRPDSMNLSNKSECNTLSAKKPMDIHKSGKGMSPSPIHGSTVDQPFGSSPHATAVQAIRP